MRLMAVLLAALILVNAPASAKKPGGEAAALVARAHKASATGRQEAALKLFAKAIALKQLKGTDLAGAHNGRAVILSELKRRPEAIEEMTRAIAAAPKEPFYYGNRARIYRAMKMPAKAVADFSRVIALSPKPSAYDYFYRCQAHAEAKARAKAIADCEKSLALKPKYGRAAKLLKKLKAGS
jgi:tetratricopeptide (TPR) repeat protein